MCLNNRCGVAKYFINSGIYNCVIYFDDKIMIISGSFYPVLLSIVIFILSFDIGETPDPVLCRPFGITAVETVDLFAIIKSILDLYLLYQYARLNSLNAGLKFFQ